MIYKTKNLIIHTSDELYHHGIKGQKWGVQNGPPYPLDQKTHNKVTKGSGSDGKDKYGDPTALLIYVSLKVLPILIAAGCAAAMSASAKSKYKKMVAHREEEETDKKTGLKKKDTEMTEDEDIKMVNPLFRTGDVTSSNNCMCCTTTYDIRRRGFDVTAGIVDRGFDSDILKKWYKDPKIKTVERPKADITMTSNRDIQKKYVDNVMSTLRKEKEGSRGNLMVSWSLGYSGHSMVYQVRNGNVEIIDTQTGKKYTKEKEVRRIIGQSRATQYCRTDNLEPNYKYLQKEGIIR